MITEEELKPYRKRALWNKADTTHSTAYDQSVVKKILPHRDPFLFVDTIEEIDLEQKCLSGTRTISESDPVFLGHFPGDPIYPGVLQLEIIGQFGLCLAHFLGQGTHLFSDSVTPRNVRALKLFHASWLGPVLPGDRLTVHAKVVDFDDFTATCAGQIIGPKGNITTLASMEVYFVD